MLQQFIGILEKSREHDLIPFLKSLTGEEKKKLVPEIKKLFKEYTDFKETTDLLGNRSWTAKGNEKQKTILLITSFVCYNRQDFERTTFPGWILDEKHFRKVMDWYIPSWFNDFVNKLAQSDFLPYTLNYRWALELAEKGFLNLSNEIIVRLLPQIIFENEGRITVYKPEKTLENPATLQEHIWYLFELESAIHYSSRYLNFGSPGEKKTGWIELFKQYSAAGKIERSRLLRESLLASNKNFNNQLSGWFIELFTELEPDSTELLNLQKELFSVLSSPQSKPVNTVLQYFKKLVSHQSFDGNSFLENVSVLLSSDKKNTLVSTISILDKLAKKKKDWQLPVCKAVLPAFIHANDEIQLRAAKLIAAYQDICGEEFKEMLQPYHSSLMMSSKNLLQDLLSAETYPYQETDIKLPDAETATVADRLPGIPLPESIDDFIFLASQAFDNNQSWHIDILPAALVKWQHELQGENIARLEPALQRALQMTRSEFRAGQGTLDHMLAIFFIDVCILFVRKFPAYSNKLNLLFSKFDQKDGANQSSWLAIAEGEVYMAGWDSHSKDSFYLPHKNLLLCVLQKLIHGDNQPLLSTPTHEPGYILPEILAQRILRYQQSGKPPFNIDAQIAVSRCLQLDTATAIKITEEQLEGEYKNLLLFLFGRHELPQPPFENPAVWMCCSLAKKEKKRYDAFAGFSYYKNPFACYTGGFPWYSKDEEYEKSEYDYQLRKSITKKARRKILRVITDRTPVKESAGFKKILSGILSKPKESPFCIYDSFIVKAQWISLENDVRRILMLTPANPEPFLAEITRRFLPDPTFSGESEKRAVTACLQAIYEIWDDFGDMAYLFLGTCMISSDKTIRNISGEIWLKAVSEHKMNNEKLGAVIGKHESIEFAPLKRLTDLMSQSMFRISAVHNKNLLELTETMLAHLSDLPVNNLKKLLELYLELLSINNTISNNQKLQNKFNAWHKNAGLQKIIKTIIEKK